MIVNSENLNLVFEGFQTVFNDAFEAAPSQFEEISMIVPSASREETYGWIGQFPQLREWVGPRHVNNLQAYGFKIRNRTFESTVSVKRSDMEDDRIGIFKPMLSEMGQFARRHPEELVFGLLKDGFGSVCFDGQTFFAEDHPIEVDGKKVAVSNMDDGTEEPWFLLDTSRAIRPIIWQERTPYEFQTLTRDDDHHVFMNDEYLYGVRARVNAGLGLWQLAYGSKNELTAGTYAAARAAMQDFRSDGGRVLGIKPTVMVVPPSLEEAALHLLNTETKAGGGSNPWKGTVKLIVSPYVKG